MRDTSSAHCQYYLGLLLSHFKTQVSYCLHCLHGVVLINPFYFWCVIVQGYFVLNFYYSVLYTVSDIFMSFCSLGLRQKHYASLLKHIINGFSISFNICSVRLWGIHFGYFGGLSAPMLVTFSPIDSWQLFILGIGTPIAVLP